MIVLGVVLVTVLKTEIRKVLLRRAGRRPDAEQRRDIRLRSIKANRSAAKCARSGSPPASSNSMKS